MAAVLALLLAATVAHAQYMPDSTLQVGLLGGVLFGKKEKRRGRRRKEEKTQRRARKRKKKKNTTIASLTPPPAPAPPPPPAAPLLLFFCLFGSLVDGGGLALGAVADLPRLTVTAARRPAPAGHGRPLRFGLRRAAAQRQPVRQH